MVCTIEEKTTKKVIKKALSALGKKNFVFIMHNASFPACKDENTGFGTVNSNGGKKFINYAQGLFDAIQMGPAGKTKLSDASPYTGTIFSGNPLFIDLKELTTKKWGNILPQETFDEIVQNNPNKGKNRTSYTYIYKKQEEALSQAYDNFLKLNDKKLHKEFESYKIQNKIWLDNDSLYEALAIENESDYWHNWKSETDKNLLNPKSQEEKIKYAKRIDEISKKYSKEIDKYKFIQFVLHIQNEETKEYAASKNIKMIADRQVAFSDRDEWAYQSLFLEGWYLGCPPDYFSKDGQAWGFPVMNPEKLYNGDGTLGEGGILMKNLFKKMFKENPGGVRIDHIVGLIDPWVYKKGFTPRPEEGAGRLYSSPEHPFLKKFAIPKLEDLDEEVGPDKEKRVKTLSKEQIKLYGRLVQIVIDAAKEEGLTKDAIVCEDLGTLTNPVASVMKEYQLMGMKLTQFTVPTEPDDPYRCKNIPEKCWAMIGTHDNRPVNVWAKSLIHTHEGYLHAKNLVEDLFSESENKDDIIVKLTNDADFLKETKLVELFASKAQNLQIFFTDFFDMWETYNVPGTSGNQNWSLRLPDDFETMKTINLPLILKKAIIARGEKFASKNKKIIKELDEIQ
ncbi:MAG: 4-alpha-glucanotransferase [Cyanobacteriota bacterium]|nr:4-alpha-glucanotransferase [Cyanobacteriota bacterium]MDY6359224.1 4-alpha-glucanotransferase [Cyanobacteriota bacterium]MDY6364965.1 4-alpha-glucanotransferase [Cyanobacteriota bacterium]MDY6383248.1 4-alpha-glucanotransferase [Cyanobacteriota bacterium]